MPRIADMGENPVGASREKVGEVYRFESRRVFVTLVRVLGDFDLAEDALHNAFAAAFVRWSRSRTSLPRTRGAKQSTPKHDLLQSGEEVS